MGSSSGSVGAGARVLVIDDDPAAAATLCGVLAAGGFRAEALPEAMRRSFTGGIIERATAQALLSSPVSVVLVSFSRSGIQGVTALVQALRSRPEPRVGGAAIVGMIDDESDLLFGLGIDLDAALVRPVDARQIVESVTDVAATNPSSLVARRSRFTEGNPAA